MEDKKPIITDEERELSARQLYRKSEQQRHDAERRARPRYGDTRTPAQVLFNRSNMNP